MNERKPKLYISRSEKKRISEIITLVLKQFRNQQNKEISEIEKDVKLTPSERRGLIKERKILKKCATLESIEKELFISTLSRTLSKQSSKNAKMIVQIVIEYLVNKLGIPREKFDLEKERSTLNAIIELAEKADIKLKEEHDDADDFDEMIEKYFAFEKIEDAFEKINISDFYRLTNALSTYIVLQDEECWSFICDFSRLNQRGKALMKTYIDAMKIDRKDASMENMEFESTIETMEKFVNCPEFFNDNYFECAPENKAQIQQKWKALRNVLRLYPISILKIIAKEMKGFQWIKAEDWDVALKYFVILSDWRMRFNEPHFIGMTLKYMKSKRGYILKPKRKSFRRALGLIKNQ